MHRKLSGYFLLSFLSFCFFTVIFLAVANVQGSADQSVLQRPANNQIVPTPTIYMGQAADTTTITEAQSPSPTPTVYEAHPQIHASAAQAPTQEQTKIEPTATPVPPTATPTPTDAPTPTATPLPTQTPQPSSSDLDTLFSQYSSTYNVSVDELKKIAGCESGFNTNSDSGYYTGMFQFSPN